jgi:DNA-binding XRE family transcriptional regulator
MRKKLYAHEVAYERYVRGRPRMEAMLREERQKTRLAVTLRRLREEAGLTQSELARRIGTTPSVISRLEDPDYEGHSLRTLRRVVAALGMGLELRAVQRNFKQRPMRAVLLA